jgi:hypothetical protein
VLRGEVPYRDFWTIYAPGHFYLLALLFGVFGTHLLVETVAASLVCAAAVCACYWLVYNLFGRLLDALFCALILLAVLYNSPFFKYLGSYPPSILLILIALSLIVLYYRRERLGFLGAAGLATGALTVFKHDVGGYTAIATLGGLVVYHLLRGPGTGAGRRAAGRVGAAFLSSVAVYLAGLALIAIPVGLYFALVAGPDMLRDLIVFPTTDFRYSRPERYPSIFRLRFDADTPLTTIRNLLHYLNFALPFLMFVLGLIATGVAVIKRKPLSAAMGMTFAIAYLFHHVAAHVQVNTHIVSMSVYGVLLGLLFLDLTGRGFSLERPAGARVLVWGLAVVWLSSLAAVPAYEAWTRRNEKTAELTLVKASGIRLPPHRVRELAELSAFVSAHVAPHEKLFVGLHRHDTLIIGNVMLYFVLDRASATRYHELHPAITDTAPVQREMIRDIREENIPLIIRERIFPDETLERWKKNFLKKLPQIGATDLDEFIRANYVKVRQFGPHEVWLRRDIPTAPSVPPDGDA